MDLIPYVGGTQLTASSVVVKVNELDSDRAEELVLRTCTIVQVDDPDSFFEARRAVASLKAMIEEITLSKKSAKAPFTAVGRSIDELADSVNAPVQAEHQRILALMKIYVEKLEAERKAFEARRQAMQHEAERKIAEAKTAQLKANNEDAKALADLNLARAQLDRQMAVEAAPLAQAGVVPGGRVSHPYKFKLVDKGAVFASGNLRLLRVELDILACQDAVKAQLERGETPHLPGIEITQETTISVKAAART